MSSCSTAEVVPRGIIAKSNLADAYDLAHVLIITAGNDPFVIDLQQTVYALDATTIDLCLSMFPSAPFRQSKAAIKLHTLLDLRGNIPRPFTSQMEPCTM